ncbi:MAG: hypothetical protein V1893_03160 [Candidatus Omnitrophota bacterium]
MADKKTYRRRFVCIYFTLIIGLVCTVFSAGNFLSAAIPDNPTDRATGSYESLKISDIKIPEGFGKVIETNQGNSDNIIVHLQDLHCNYDGQMSIVRILRHLMKNYGLKLVNCEGASGEIDPSLFVFKDKKMQRKVSKFFLKQGQLTGAEYLLINNEGEYPLELWGVEDEEPYLRHIEIFKKTYEKSKELKRLCDNILGALSKLKKVLYPDELIELDEKYAAYDNKDIEVNEYIDYLKQMAEDKDVDISKFENFYFLTKLVSLEGNIEFVRVDKERAQLIDDLSKVLPKESFTAFFQKSLSYKAGELTGLEYFTSMKEVAEENNVDLTIYPNLKNYIDYVYYSEKINKILLFSELDGVADAIRDKMLTTSEQKRVAQLSKHVQLLKKFFDTSMTNEEMDYFTANKGDFVSKVFSDVIKETAQKNNIRVSLDPNLSLIDISIPEEEEFYNIAFIRDDALMKNTAYKMRVNDDKFSALIAGGFHTKGLTERFKEQGISYIVVSPNVTNLDEDLYFSVMMNKEVPVEKLLEEDEEGKESVW